MTTEELAIAVCGATYPCPTIDGEDAYHVGCPNKCMSGFLYVLGERARKPCLLGLHHYSTDIEAQIRLYGRETRCSCDGRGWHPAILLPKEPCPEDSRLRAEYTASTGRIVPDAIGALTHPDNCQCGGSGSIQRVDALLLVGLLEEAGWYVDYLVAAAKALGVEAEV